MASTLLKLSAFLSENEIEALDLHVIEAFEAVIEKELELRNAEWKELQDSLLKWPRTFDSFQEMLEFFNRFTHLQRLLHGPAIPERHENVRSSPENKS